MTIILWHHPNNIASLHVFILQVSASFLMRCHRPHSLADNVHFYKLLLFVSTPNPLAEGVLSFLFYLPQLCLLPGPIRGCVGSTFVPHRYRKHFTVV